MAMHHCWDPLSSLPGHVNHRLSEAKNPWLWCQGHSGHSRPKIHVSLQSLACAANPVPITRLLCSEIGLSVNLLKEVFASCQTVLKHLALSAKWRIAAFHLPIQNLAGESGELHHAIHAVVSQPTNQQHITKGCEVRHPSQTSHYLYILRVIAKGTDLNKRPPLQEKRSERG